MPGGTAASYSRAVMGFEFRLIPPRPDFAMTMTPQEREVMTEHAAYWTRLMAAGKVLAFGPVADPFDGHGLGIILADGPAEAEALRAADPALHGIPDARTLMLPMPRLVTPTGVYQP